MENLSIEEKAKRYDEAIEKAKNWYVDSQIDFKESLENLFPELKESEDEKIRKTLISLFSSNAKKEWYDIPTKKIVAWLEKQGERTSSQTNERAWLYLVSDVLTWKDGIGQYLDNPRVQELAKKLCSEYSQKLYNPSVLSNSSNTGRNEQKPAWNEEDEEMFNDICIDIMEYIPKSFEENSKKVNWLKSLRPQKMWKPSDEQMVVLNDIIINGRLSNANERILKGLQEQLKKLREE